VGVAPGELARLSERGFEARTDGGETLWKVGRRELGAAVVKVGREHAHIMCGGC
jgi:hypothetical protein